MSEPSFAFKIAAACTILVIIGFLDLPYGYYTLLRLCLCGAAVVLAWLAYEYLGQWLL